MAKTLLSSFMEAANILMIDGLSDKDKVGKTKRNPVLLESLEENKTNFTHREQLGIQDKIYPFVTKLEENNVLENYGMPCDSCNFKTIAKARNNQMSVLKRHKRTVHGEDGDRFTTIEMDRLTENVQNISEGRHDIMDTDVEEPVETKLEDVEHDLSSNVEGISCDTCDFTTTAKLKHNQNSVMKRHKRTAHGEEKDGLTEIIVDKKEDFLAEIIVDKREDLFGSNTEELNALNAASLSCSICGFVTTAKSKNNQQSVMGRHNRKVHGHGEYADVHLAENSDLEPKEEQVITLDEDLKEPHDEELSSFSDETVESCQICGFKSVAKSKCNRSTVLKRHMATVHESKSGEMTAS